MKHRSRSTKNESRPLVELWMILSYLVLVGGVRAYWFISNELAVSETLEKYLLLSLFAVLVVAMHLAVATRALVLVKGNPLVNIETVLIQLVGIVCVAVGTSAILNTAYLSDKLHAMTAYTVPLTGLFFVFAGTWALMVNYLTVKASWTVSRSRH